MRHASLRGGGYIGYLASARRGDLSVVIGARRFFEPHVWTSKLSNDFVRMRKPEEPDGWLVETVTPDEWRLYLRVGEAYSETGFQFFRPPVRLEIKSRMEFVRIRPLPREQWWEASFVCPFCGHLCTGESKCDHMIVAHGQVVQALWTTPLGVLHREMSERVFSCNLLNLGVAGLRVKLPRQFFPLEWFRPACLYAEGREVVPVVAEALARAKLASAT